MLDGARLKRRPGSPKPRIDLVFCRLEFGTLRVLFWKLELGLFSLLYVLLFEQQRQPFDQVLLGRRVESGQKQLLNFRTQKLRPKKETSTEPID